MAPIVVAIVPFFIPQDEADRVIDTLSSLRGRVRLISCVDGPTSADKEPFRSPDEFMERLAKLAKDESDWDIVMTSSYDGDWGSLANKLNFGLQQVPIGEYFCVVTPKMRVMTWDPPVDVSHPVVGAKWIEDYCVPFFFRRHVKSRFDSNGLVCEDGAVVSLRPVPHTLHPWPCSTTTVVGARSWR